MGWSQGIGIGWPNASAQVTPIVYTFNIIRCAEENSVVYSSSTPFGPGIYVYTDPELMFPFITAFDWGLDLISVYSIDANGLVQNNGHTCE
jgi:hypothetical protein